MLTQICQYLRNWFAREKYIGTFKIEDGVAKYADGSALPLVPGQYYRIIGSLFNDGVHRIAVPAETQETNHEPGETETEPEVVSPPSIEEDTDLLLDEPVFSGAIWSMAVPPKFLELAEQIGQWCKDNAAVIASPYSSESFGGYSYSIRSTYSDGGYSNLSWETQFASQLGPWRKI